MVHMNEILVFGHRNPDNDSVSSAVAYTYLKSVTDPARTYKAARLGAAPSETEWVFERFGAPLPELIAHVRVRVAVDHRIVVCDPLVVELLEPELAGGRRGKCPGDTPLEDVVAGED